MARLFKNIEEVVNFLTDEGWKISIPSAYRHWSKEGKIRARKDRKFSEESVLEYANTHLSRIDGAPEGTLAEDKLRAEIARIQADAATRDLKLRKLTGELIQRSDVEFMLSDRANSLRSYLDAIARSSAGRVIKIVGGDQQKASALISWWLGMNRKAMDNYARPIHSLEEEDE